MKQTKSFLYLALLFLNTIHAKVLVVGGSSNTGYSIVSHCKRQNIPCHIFARDLAKVKAIHGSSEMLTYFEGKAERDVEALSAAAQGCTAILMAQDFPFNVWSECVLKTTDNCITAAQKSNSLLVYPGRIYKYGLTSLIQETSPADPNSEQGRTLEKVEQKLEDAASKGRCRVIIMRHSYPFGPGTKDGLMSVAFTDVPKGKPFKWIARTDLETQLTYLPDFATLFFKIISDPGQYAPLEIINISTHTVGSIDEFGKQLAELASGKDATISYAPNVHSFIAMKALSLIDDDTKRGVDTFYSFANKIELDTTKMKLLFPDFTATPLSVAIRRTLKSAQE